jgi:anti-sigma factor RsiW
MADRHVGGDVLSAFLDDELSDERALDVTRHLRGCELCLEVLEELRTAREALRRLPDLQAPVLVGGVRARPDVLTDLTRRLRWVGVVVLAAGLLLGLGGVAYLVGDDGEVVPPVELFIVDHVARTGGGPVPAPIGTTER